MVLDLLKPHLLGDILFRSLVNQVVDANRMLGHHAANGLEGGLALELGCLVEVVQRIGVRISRVLLQEGGKTVLLHLGNDRLESFVVHHGEISFHFLFISRKYTAAICWSDIF